MMLLNRVAVGNLIKVGVRTSYRLLPAKSSSLVSTDDVVELLNGARMNGMPTINDGWIPQLYSPEEMADVLGVTASKIRAWCRHSAPCWKLGRDYRMDRSAFESWLDSPRSNGVHR